MRKTDTLAPHGGSFESRQCVTNQLRRLCDMYSPSGGRLTQADDVPFFLLEVGVVFRPSGLRPTRRPSVLEVDGFRRLHSDNPGRRGYW